MYHLTKPSEVKTGLQSERRISLLSELHIIVPLPLNVTIFVTVPASDFSYHIIINASELSFTICGVHTVMPSDSV